MAGKRSDIHTDGVPVLCRSCEARHRGICGALTSDELTELARHTHKARHAPGEELIGDGTDVDSFANVMRGVVKLSKGLEDGRRQIVGLQFAPDFLGRPFGSENTLTAEAASEVELCVVSKTALERMMAEKPALENRLMHQTLRELDEARDWLVTVGRKTALERVASLLHRIATYTDPAAESGGEVTFELPLTRADAADFLGLTLETVSRQLGALRRLGVIRITGTRMVTVPELRSLKALCG